MNLKILSGNANPKLAQGICAKLGVDLCNARVGRFKDGEIQVKILDNVRGADCYIVQPTSPPVNENLMELLIITDALKRASAKNIIAVVPYYGYSRQDRKAEPRVPITARLVADLLATAGITRLLTLDLHAAQIQGFFNICVDHLYASPVLLSYLRKQKTPNTVVVSPDAGGVERARAFAKHLDCELVIVDKRRPRPNEAAIMNIIGQVQDRDCIILDDIVDTAGTLIKVATALKEKGAKKILAVASHGIFSGDAKQKINESCIEQIIITDSIPLIADGQDLHKFVVLSAASLLAEAIMRISNNKSISALFV
ncbi:MAG: ribose-phosphate pyrophosphokinase [Elusimicrobiota bacterium]|jgi:ribose-phosphate pyrophosphokinase|nr:ribose-phosphate pyrophosphokinase [Elusimicrobiota bacterium]